MRAFSLFFPRAQLFSKLFPVVCTSSGGFFSPKQSSSHDTTVNISMWLMAILVFFPLPLVFVNFWFFWIRSRPHTTDNSTKASLAFKSMQRALQNTKPSRNRHGIIMQQCFPFVWLATWIVAQNNIPFEIEISNSLHCFSQLFRKEHRGSKRPTCNCPYCINDNGIFFCPLFSLSKFSIFPSLLSCTSTCKCSRVEDTSQSSEPAFMCGSNVAICQAKVCLQPFRSGVTHG